MLDKMCAFLARALQGLSMAVGDVGPQPGTAGLWTKGITVLERRENLFGWRAAALPGRVYPAALPAADAGGKCRPAAGVTELGGG